MSQLWDIFVLFLRLGLVAFGSGASVLSEMERETVARNWMDHNQFIQAFAISQLTPGPQVLFTTVIGYFAAGYPGAVLATIGFCLPPAVLTVILATLWSRPSRSPWPTQVRVSLGPIAIGLIGASSYTLAPTAMHTAWETLLAIGCFALINLRKGISPLSIILLGAAVGAVIGQFFGV